MILLFLLMLARPTSSLVAFLRLKAFAVLASALLVAAELALAVFADAVLAAVVWESVVGAGAEWDKQFRMVADLACSCATMGGKHETVGISKGA